MKRDFALSTGSLMNKKFFLFIILGAGLFRYAVAQQPEPYPHGVFGEGATKTTVVNTDGKLNKTVTVTIRDKEGNIRQVDTWIQKVDGSWTIEMKSYTVGGALQCHDSYTIDVNKTVTRYETWYKGHGKDIYVRSPQGEMISTKDGEPFPFQEKMDKDIADGIKEMEKKNPSPDPQPTSCSRIPGSSCQPAAAIIAGYSFLNSFYDSDSESFPLGLQATFIYPVSLRVGVGVDGSFHTKKINDETLRRFFLLATATFTLGQVRQCSRTLIPSLHVLAGLGCEKYGDSKGSGWAVGGGARLDIKCSPAIALRAQGDLIAVKFKEQDKLNTNIRAGMGVVIRLRQTGHAD